MCPKVPLDICCASLQIQFIVSSMTNLSFFVFLNGEMTLRSPKNRFVIFFFQQVALSSTKANIWSKKMSITRQQTQVLAKFNTDLRNIWFLRMLQPKVLTKKRNLKTSSWLLCLKELTKYDLMFLLLNVEEHHWTFLIISKFYLLLNSTCRSR